MNRALMSHNDEWPTATADRLDREIEIRVQKMGQGTATSADIKEVKELVRARVDQMTPRVLAQIRQRRAG